VDRPLILLGNDDGYAAPGLGALRSALAPTAEVVVCAPERNQSGVSHALTLAQVLRLRRVEDGVYAVDGTPADCVYVALNAGTRVLPRRPDLVLSGVNVGPNLGVDIHYSGTVAVAREGALRGIPSMAVSMAVHSDVRAVASLAARLAGALLAEAAPSALDAAAPLLNVNVPKTTDGELCITTLGRRTYDDEVVFRRDPRGQEYAWIGSAVLSFLGHDATDCDTVAFQAGRVGITPLVLYGSAEAHREIAQRVLDRVAAARHA
jgi:5'-nucleotidase